ncbi:MULTISPECIES: aspartate--tRNA ligase [Bacillota]|uniref:Aspartate--tRNA ligase n=2 Tax=Amedibacillus TaxID=2749846 RepID=A0A7G9GMK1_9FIRM|nr:MULTISPECIES: aspartate--tRNA ligase [Bacillota]QNM12033.1 aspartate--tRNA ligase [[Eubacterium] hominis]MCH4286617.1 aspartate--tRNA ligase [Amedibacillus hominis]RGB53099.1 aspartate--tRNA ligase [Absiella sp. AM22-9]RGB59390.1 aspartate--tRNA ligase [Absiella sp. AM10-20]RGB66638.1 aspartate--tRNA ligase [Absiella sp. AM09-45]
MKRTHTNGELRLSNVNEQVTLIGWVAKRRNFGALVFIDLRDRSGITQLVFNEELAKQISDVRNEYILQVSGIVVERKDKNPKLATGDIEIQVEEVTIVNKAETTPIIVADETDALEDTRLKYRYLDLRRSPIQKNLMLRHQVTMITRNFLSDHGFLEIETPILCKSTPEGARDYLVPSRVSPGEFYALPQSPQIYKQLLMVGGLEKYFQIARCFRDEDLRADRQPEFTQIDIEMSFIEEEDIWNITEELMRKIFKEIKHVDLPEFVRIPYDECMERFGSDKPDMRFGMELCNVNDIFANTTFKIFADVLENKGVIQAMVVKGGADKFSRKDLDKLQEFVKVYGAKALAYLKLANGEFSGSVAKVVSDEEKAVLKAQLGLEDNDLLFMVAAKKKVAQTSLGALRNKLGHDLNLIDESKFAFLWVTNFPMFEYVEEEDRYVAAHHPFTCPNLEDVDKLMSDPANCYSRAYDLVLNGYELLSGSIRIHDQELQKKVFEAIGMSLEEAYNKFGFFIDAFKYGTPPHGGVGIGLERLVMILAGTDNIRDVVAFPKTASASDLMSEAPSPVYDEQLKELHIGITHPVKEH